jgi:hypothetical protein
MTTASTLLALSLTTAEVATSVTTDNAAGKVGPDPVGILQAAKLDILAARRKLSIVSGLIGAGTEKTAIDAMVTALT